MHLTGAALLAAPVVFLGVIGSGPVLLSNGDCECPRALHRD